MATVQTLLTPSTVSIGSSIKQSRFSRARSSAGASRFPWKCEKPPYKPAISPGRKHRIMNTYTKPGEGACNEFVAFSIPRDWHLGRIPFSFILLYEEGK